MNPRTLPAPAARAAWSAGRRSPGSAPSQPQVQRADEPRYAPDGDLQLPNGFETWVFVGSNLGLSYTPDAAAAPAVECRQAHQPGIALFFSSESLQKSGTTASG